MGSGKGRGQGVTNDDDDDDRAQRGLKFASNQHFDEALELSDEDESDESNSHVSDSRGSHDRFSHRGDTPPQEQRGSDAEEEDDSDRYGDEDKELETMNKEARFMSNNMKNDFGANAKMTSADKAKVALRNKRLRDQELNRRVSTEDSLTGGDTDDDSRRERMENSMEDSDDGNSNDEYSDTRTRRPRRHDDDSNDETDDSNDDDESGKDDGDANSMFVGGYDPEDFADLDEAPEVMQAFEFISAYNPRPPELDTKLAPFLPDYIPCIGDIDPMLNIFRPDQSDKIAKGLLMLNEPAAVQSDQAALELKLRALSKKPKGKVKVRSVPTNKDTKQAIDQWIKNIDDLHDNQSEPPTVTYSKLMPSIEDLMQAWPPAMEKQLQRTHLPPADLDIDIKNYAQVLCTLADIPVYKKRIESLHVLFTLYSVFTESQHQYANNSNSNDNHVNTIMNEYDTKTEGDGYYGSNAA